MTAVEGNASVYQVLYMGRITGEERTDFVRAWGLSLNKRDIGCAWDTRVCWMAAYCGHLELIKWARSQNPPWKRRI